MSARQLPRAERPVRSRVAKREVAGGIAYRLEQRLGNAWRYRDAERIAIPRHIFDRDIAAFAGDRNRYDAARALQVGQRGANVWQDTPRLELADRQVADPDQQVVQTVARFDPVLLVQMLQLPLDGVECVGIEQLAQLGVAQQLAQLRLIHRQRLRPSLRQRGITVVDVVGDVTEEKRGRERRWDSRLDRRQAERARLEAAQRVDERRQVEVVAQHLAVRFEQRRERSEA